MALKTKPKNKKNILIRLCILAFAAFAAFQLIEMQMELGSLKRELSSRKEILEVQRLSNKEVERQLAEIDDDSYIERIAREKLDYVDPDEIVFVDISGS